MKFIHAADFHLGACPESSSLLAKEREQAVTSSLSRVVDLCNKEKTDLLLIPGDLFNRPPLRRELKEVAYTLSRLKTARVVITAGNHDYLSEGCTYLNYDLGEKVHLLSSPEMESIYFEEINTEVHGFSYYSNEIKEAKYDNLRAPIDDRVHVLLAHGGDQKHIPIKYAELAASGYDYIALGHIHQPKLFKGVHMAYSGSPEPLDKTDIGPRGVFIGDVTKNTFSILWHPLAKSQYRTLDIVSDNTLTQAALEDCVSEALENYPSDMFIVNITGSRDPDLDIDSDAVKSLGRVVQVNDDTDPEYDISRLLAEHNGDLISYYINTLDTKDQTPVMKKALYYGLKELLK